jgi:hypothetical protein
MGQDISSKNIPSRPLLGDVERPGSPAYREEQSQDYSWERLAPARKREVLHMVRKASGKRRGRMIALLVVLLLIFVVLIAMYFFLPGGQKIL